MNETVFVSQVGYENSMQSHKVSGTWKALHQRLDGDLRRKPILLLDLIKSVHSPCTSESEVKLNYASLILA